MTELLPVSVYYLSYICDHAGQHAKRARSAGGNGSERPSPRDSGGTTDKSSPRSGKESGKEEQAANKTNTLALPHGSRDSSLR